VLNQVERRRSPRVATVNHPNFPPTVLDVGLGGLSVELPRKLPAGAVRDIGLRIGADSEMVLRMRVAYARRERRATGKHVFVTGLEFLADVTDQASSVELRLAS
jgi:hypothetical protein